MVLNLHLSNLLIIVSYCCDFIDNLSICKMDLIIKATPRLWGNVAAA